MSIVIPLVDLAPSVASRVVTIKVAELHEGPTTGPASVTFILPGDLRVPADGVIIRAGAVTVDLVNGEGQVRLPTFDADAVADGVGSDWYLLVRKSWTEQVDMIRVPAGTGSISLAAINPVQAISPRAGEWLLTGAGVELVQGSDWNATVTVAGGVARFKFTVPPAAVAYWRGATRLATTTDLDTLETGKYSVWFAADATTLGLPGNSAGILTVSRFNIDRGVMTYETAAAVPETFIRSRSSTGWTPWSPATPNPFMKTGALGTTHLDEVKAAGIYHQPSDTAGTAARGYPLSYGANAGRGTLMVTGSGTDVHHAYYDTLVGQIATRHFDGTVWSKWRYVNPQRRKNLAAEHLDTITEEGVYIQKTSSFATTANGYPAGAVHGILTVQSMGGAPSDAYYVATWLDSWNGWMSVRRFYAGAWTAWEKIADDYNALATRIAALEASSGGGGAATALVRSSEHEMRTLGLKQRIGRVQHPGKAVVAFVFDHGSKNFQDIILPKLRQHSMKSTLAMTSTQLTLEPTNEVAAWSTVAGWAATDRVEIASHSRTHQDVSGTANLRKEIVDSRTELSANLGGLPVDSWVQPGARSVIDATKGAYDGFKDGLGADVYTSTAAGEMIWNSYAVVTGQVTQQTTRVYPCTGESPLGAARRFIDDGQAGIDAAKADIQAAIASGGRCIVSLHPAYIRTDGRTDNITQAQVEAFIDYLAGLVSAGSIAMVQLREWGIAEAGQAATAATPPPTVVEPYAAHAIRQERLTYDMGGPIDTGGRGAVAFRIDHGWKNFKEKLLPIFQAAGIVPMVAYNPRDWSRTENEGVTAADVNGWVAAGLIEIANHGAVHANATGTAAITDFVAASLAEIETQLPAAVGKVYGFCVPGVSTVPSPYDGFENGSTPEKWDTFMGRTILKHHAVGYGYMPGTHLRILDGIVRDGQSHYTLDSATVTAATAQIDNAISQRRGLQFMLHPSLLDTAGSMTTAQVQQIVDYAVAKRSAGTLLTLSSYQMLVADSTRPASATSARDTGWRNIVPTGAAVDPAEPGVVQLRRIGDQVFCRLNGVAIVAGTSNAWLAPNGIPPGFTLGTRGFVSDVPGGYASTATPNRAVRHRISVQENDIAYVGFIFNWDGLTVEAARNDGTRRIFGALPSWMTDDPFPA